MLIVKTFGQPGPSEFKIKTQATQRSQLQALRHTVLHKYNKNVQ